MQEIKRNICVHVYVAMFIMLKYVLMLKDLCVSVHVYVYMCVCTDAYVIVTMRCITTFTCTLFVFY